ncbi:MAG: sulfite exporter TauE/SafE family protein, partial [Gemmatimonadaceae bacterium]
QKLLGNVLRSVREQPVAMRAAVTGLVTTLIPCGWLYVFVVAAAGTGSAQNGMLLMAIFWLGNVPALVAVGVGAQHLFGPFRQRLPALSAVTVVFMGALAITGHLLFGTAQHHGH